MASGWNERGVRSLSDHYHEAFQSHRSEDLLQLMKRHLCQISGVAPTGKASGHDRSDLKKKAEELVYSEFSAALGIPLRRWKTISLGGWSPGRRKSVAKGPP